MPLIRRADAPKRADVEMDPERVMDLFREATWEEALELAGGKLRQIRDQYGPKALAGFGSAKGSNEEAYLFQKLVRTGFRSNNVDHCTRLCHASSVVALLEGIGSGAVSNPVMDVTKAEVVIVIGANPTVNHPVAATWIKNAVHNGTKLIVCDPRRSDLARLAHRYLQFKPDTDVAMLNAMMHVIVTEGLVDQAFIDSRTIGYEDLRKNVEGYSPEAMAPICGIDAQTLREVARLYATSKALDDPVGHGHLAARPRHRQRALPDRAVADDRPDRPARHRPASAARPEQRAGRVRRGPDPDDVPRLPARGRTRPCGRRFEKAWGMAPGSLDAQPGLTVVEVMHAIKAGKVRGMYVMGENPAMSDPDANHARESLAALEHLVVQDIFLTETAYLADVILPASAFPEKTGSFTNTDRLVQMGRQAIDPPGQAKQDLWIIQEIAQRLGLDWQYGHVSEVFDEMRHTMPSIAGITWDRLDREHAVTYPCRKEGDPGQSVVFVEDFPREGGRGRFVPADIIPADERPDAEYPMVLITGRQLEHWHTGSMTRRATVLDAIEPDPVALIHPLDLQAMAVTARRRGDDRVAARQRLRSMRAPTTARRAARCSCPSATTRRRPTS